MRVLVVEDERVLAEEIAEGLREEAMAVDVALDGEAALEKASVNAYDVIVLDRDLPRIHGDEVCRRLVRGEAGDAGGRVLMLTASGGLEQRVEGLNLGADDYLAKSFAFAELVARVRALSRRRAPARPPVLSRKGVTLDTAMRRVTRGGRVVELSKKEFAVLEALLEAQGAVVTSEQLLEKVWDEHADPFTNTVRVTMGRLRRKLHDPDVIETVVGVGYRL